MKQIFINLPVEDLDKSMAFYTQLGFTNYPLFTSKVQNCMTWGEYIFVMLQTKGFFGSVVKKTISDTKNYIAASFTLPVESLDAVNKIVENGLKAGGTEPVLMIDEGFMQIRCIEDLDGHIWSIIYLDIEKFKDIRENHNS